MATHLRIFCRGRDLVHFSFVKTSIRNSEYVKDTYTIVEYEIVESHGIVSLYLRLY